jgi:hypothetical protein
VCNIIQEGGLTLMAGPKDYFTYTTDNNEKYSVLVDQTRGNLAGFSFDAYSSTNKFLPRRMSMRYVLARPAGTNLLRKFTIGKATAAFYHTGGTFIWNGVSHEVISAHGEVRMFNHKVHAIE